MTRPAPVPDTTTVHVPFRLLKRGGCKEIQVPLGSRQKHNSDNTLVKALTRAFRWKRILESGAFNTVWNALHDVVAKRTAALVAQMALDKLLIPPVFLGHRAPSASGASKPPGVSALQAAINEGAADHSGAWPVDQNENES